MSKARDIADLDFNSPDIDGGNIDGAVIGATTTAAANFSSLGVNSPSPSQPLEVGGTSPAIKMNSSGSNAGVLIIAENGVDRGFFGTSNHLISGGSSANTAIRANGTLQVASGGGTVALTIDGSQNATFTGTVEVGGTLYIPQYIEHSGDANSFFGFPGGDEFRLELAGVKRMTMNGTATTFNEDGEDRDFRVESDSHANMFVVDGGTNRVAIKMSTAEPDNTLDVNGSLAHGVTVSKKVSTGAANSNYFTIYEKDFESSAFTTNQHLVRISAAGPTNGTHGSAEFIITFKQQGGSKYFNIVPIEKTGLNIGYVWDASGGSSGNGKLKIYASSALGFYTYIQVFATNRDGNPDDQLIRGTFPMTDTGSSTAPSGLVTMNFPLNYGANKYQMSGYSSSAFVINEDGNDLDFRVESNNHTHALFVDGGNDRVSIRNSSEINSGALSVNGTITFNNQTAGTYNHASGWIDFTDSSNLLRLHSGGDPGESSHMEISTNVAGSQSDAISVENTGPIVINQDGVAARDFRVESSSDTHMFFVDGGTNEIGVGTSNPENRMEIRTNDGNTGHTSGLTLTNFSLTSNARAGISFRNYDNYGAAIYSPRTGSTQGKLVLATNTGSNTTQASVAEKLVILHAGGTEQYASVHDARWFNDSSAFSNPTINLFTGSTTGANYPQSCFEVTMYGNGVSANEHQVFRGGGTFDYNSSSNGTAQNLTTYTNYHVGNALPAAPTFSLSGNTLQITCNRQTNYDSYRVEVRVWGRSTSHAWGTHS